MRFNFLTLEEEFPCSLCKQILNEGYVPHTIDNEEFEKLEAIFEQEPEYWFVCEGCVEGYCGAVPDSQPNDWLERKWKRLQVGGKKTEKAY